jgi:hypothetical protein
VFRTPSELEPALDGIRSPWKRGVTRGYFLAAAWQRSYARRRLDAWDPPAPGPRLELDVATLASEHDSLELMRMTWSFLAHVGTPHRLTVVSDGTLTGRTTAAVRALSDAVEVCELSQHATDLPEHPLAPHLLAGDFIHAKKLAVLAQPPRGRPRLYLDTDIEFFAGAHRFRHVVADSDSAPRFMEHDEYYYDERVVAGLDVLPAVNAGFCLFKRPADWSPAFDRLLAVLDSPVGLSEQSAVAITLTREGARPLPADLYILRWDDLGMPWDAYARRDIVLRHYAHAARRWKLWLRGGPAGPRTLPAAALEAATAAVRRAGRPAPPS